MNCERRSLVDAHFGGTIAPPDERRLRTHLDECAPCRAHYRRRQIFAALDPEALAPETRIARGLGLERKPRVFVFPAAAVAALALAALLFLVVRTPKDDGFTARGSIPANAASASSKIAVYRASKSALVLAQGGVGRDDELAFSYDNASDKPYLMIFGVDDGGRVYWFYPAWTNATENPSAIKIEPGKTAQLPEAIRHPLAGERLTIHGLFLDAPLTVRDVEGALRASGLDGGMPGAVDHTTMFEVGR